MPHYCLYIHKMSCVRIIIIIKLMQFAASTCFLTDILTQIFILNLLSSIEQLLSALHTRHGIHVLTPVSHFLFLQGDSTVSAVKFILRWGYMLFNIKHCRYVFIFIALNLSAYQHTVELCSTSHALVSKAEYGHTLMVYLHCCLHSGLLKKQCELTIYYCSTYLLLLFLHSLEVGLEVHRLFDLGAQQSSEHCISRHPHPPQIGSLHLAFQLKDLLRQILYLFSNTDFLKSKQKNPSSALTCRNFY